MATTARNGWSRRPWWIALPLACAWLWMAWSARSSERMDFPAEPVLSAPDSAGTQWSGAIALPPGRYRARVTVERTGPLTPGETAAPVWVGFVPEGVTWHPDALGLRRFDLARARQRSYEFIFSTTAGERRQCVWRGDPAKQGLRLVRVEVWRERRMGSVLVLAMAATVLAVLLSVGIAGQPSSPSRLPWSVPAAIAYAVSGVLLWSMHSIGGASGVRLFPGVAPLPSLSGFSLLASGLVLAWLLRSRPVLAWTVPVAALGLSFAGTLVGPRSDFQTYYTAGLALWGHSNPYAAEPGRVLNPPPFVLACGLLPTLSVTAAGFLWFGLKIAATIACVPLARVALGDAGVWPAIMSLRYVGMDLRYGNTNVLVLYLLLLCAAASARGHERRSSAAAIVNICLKATPAWLAVAAATAKRWRWALLVFAGAFLVIAGSCVALEWVAPEAGLGFFRHAIPKAGDLEMGRIDNQSIRGMVDRFVAGARMPKTEGVPSLGWGAGPARVVEAMFDLLVLAAVARLGRRASRGFEYDKAAWASLWAGATLAMLLTSPGSWRVHFAILYLPLVVLADRGRKGDRASAVAFWTLAAVILVAAVSRAASDWMAAYSALTLATAAALGVLALSPPPLARRPEAMP